MKVVISQEVLEKALKRGGAAALSDEAQSDTTNVARLVQSVCIKIEKEIIIQSTTTLLSSRYKIPANHEGVTVHEQGTIVVPAKQLYDFISRQNTSSEIGLELEELDSPEILREGEIQEQGGQFQGVRKIGEVKILSRDQSKTGASWSLDCYSPEQLPTVDFDNKTDPMFKVSVEDFKRGLDKTVFATLDKDPDHVFDSCSLEVAEDQLYIAATDMVRCACYCIPNVKDLVRENFPSLDDPEKEKTAGKKILIPCKMLQQACKLMNKETIISFHYLNDQNRVFICSQDTDLRIATTNIEQTPKFPSVTNLFAAKYETLCTIPKDILGNRLSTASIVNESSVKIDFENGKAVIQAKSERSGYRPSKSSAPVNDLSRSFESVWHIKHLQDVIKVIDDQDIKFMVPADNDKSWKVESVEDENFSFYSIKVNNPIYDS